MQFGHAMDGDFHIYTGALEALHGDGYIAAVVVSRKQIGTKVPREVYRNESLAGGHRWESADAALRYALSKARQVIRSHMQLVTC